MLFTTSIKAIDPRDGTMKTWCGPNVPGISFNDARAYCQANGLGYCEVVGRLACEIPQKDDGSPDWDNRIDYDSSDN
jgi:hypothetical protein